MSFLTTRPPPPVRPRVLTAEGQVYFTGRLADCVWIQREQQAAIVYLIEENRVLKARGFSGGKSASPTTSDGGPR
ncbi:MAG: hypothetical protein BMS9Abin37_2852 [Acidobacteriota bacterium]|nr:MAG: hypothetical protein BMS9Abin37_2852 [Acidobacteriota bacterium]